MVCLRTCLFVCDRDSETRHREPCPVSIPGVGTGVRCPVTTLALKALDKPCITTLPPVLEHGMKPESSHWGSPILKPRRRRSKGGDGVGGRGQGSVPELWRAGQQCSGDEGGAWSKGWLGSLALKEGRSRWAERRVMQPRNSQRSWRERAMWPWVQAALDGGA